MAAALYCWRAAGAGGLLLAGSLLAAIPAAVAARTRPAALLRAG